MPRQDHKPPHPGRDRQPHNHTHDSTITPRPKRKPPHPTQIGNPTTTPTAPPPRRDQNANHHTQPRSATPQSHPRLNHTAPPPHPTQIGNPTTTPTAQSHLAQIDNPRQRESTVKRREKNGGERKKTGEMKGKKEKKAYIAGQNKIK